MALSASDCRFLESDQLCDRLAGQVRALQLGHRPVGGDAGARRYLADQRPQPTLSPKNTAAPATTKSGVACKIAEAVDNGVRTKAKA